MTCRRRDAPHKSTPIVRAQVVIMLLYLDFLQHMLFRAADIRIRKLKWRGLWMTKQIEGTVDDDVAVKLAIGEGRQADLEQERLELQALNSDCLLYTSPSPRDKRQSRMPSSA